MNTLCVRSATLPLIALLATMAGSIHAASPEAVLDSAHIRDALSGKGLSTRGMAAAPRRVALQIQFAIASTALQPAAALQLDQLWIALGDPDLRTKRIEISGHTDASGDAARNLQLSERRAAAVREYLARKGPPVDATLLSVQGYGESQPLPAIVDTDPLQRRVEIRVLDTPDAPSEKQP